MFVTFLGNGRPVTLPQITAPNYGLFTNGESGRYLEPNLFGSPMAGEADITAVPTDGVTQPMRSINLSITLIEYWHK